MDFRFLTRLALSLCAALLLLSPVQAQRSLEPDTLITSTVAPGSADSWGFAAYSGGVVSLLAEGEGDFDPVLTLQDGSGRALISNDDYSYPDSPNALLEAITLPRTDTYTAAVSGFDGAGGSYGLRMLPGFAGLHYEDSFEGDANWRSTDSDSRVSVRNGTLNISSQTPGQAGVVVSSDITPAADLYAQVSVADISHTGGWTIGISARRQGGGSILAEVNERGLWRLTATASGSTRTLRDWTPHPNIRPGETRFTFAVMLKATGIDVFYNGGFVGSAQDDSVTSAGLVGLVVSPPAAPGSQVTARLDDFIVTVPYMEHVPTEILLGDGTAMVQALRRNHVVSPAGEMVLTVPEVTAEYARPGINRVMVGRGTTYTNFVLGASLNISAARNGLAGCGLIVRAQGEEAYTLAFIDQMGGYGISERTRSGFEPGLFSENRAWQDSSHHLLIIADLNTLYYYIDGRLAGTLESAPTSGEVGTAVVNYESINTSCRFTNLWLWRW